MCINCKQKINRSRQFSQDYTTKKSNQFYVQRNIKRILSNCKQPNLSLSRQKKFHYDQPSLEALEHYSQSEYSLDNQDRIVQISPRALPRIVGDVSIEISMTQQQILAQKARQFVKRLRKQRQYNTGRAIIRRKTQQQSKLKTLKKRKDAQKRVYGFFKEQKMNKMMERIISHEQKIGFRLARRPQIERNASNIRCKTQNTNRLNTQKFGNKSTVRSNNSQFPTIQSIKHRLQSLSRVIDSLQN